MNDGVNGNVVSLFRCGGCGAKAHPVDIEFRGEVRATMHCCDACLAKTKTDLKSVEPLFGELLRWGVQRAAANAMMTALLDHKDFDASVIRTPSEKP